MIDLRSDTVTLPTAGMKEQMISAPLGDDVFRTDPTVRALEERLASDFGHEAALFCPSGTMTNQIAVQLHCERLDEIICETTTHIYQYETGGYAYNAGVAIQLIDAPGHKLSAELITSAIRPDYDWLPRSRMVIVENSANKAGGIIYTQQELEEISSTVRSQGLIPHLDGARIYNAMVAGGYHSHEIGPLFDTISVCLSKGLGCPVGSVLIGSQKDIDMALRLRKVMGGAMRQSGMLAAAGLYALDHHIDRLADDHWAAGQIADALSYDSRVSEVLPVQTNIVIARLKQAYSESDYVQDMSQRGIGIVPMGPQLIRFVTHLGLSSTDIDQVCEILKKQA